ncbi:hypothetical protein BC834DRAFT_239876 [Gloeopeniophorella convolvens]|nr:hypothetical protein BC834DRAFT_239876 [Gloeopeniophorella convolvens]
MCSCTFPADEGRSIHNSPGFIYMFVVYLHDGHVKMRVVYLDINADLKKKKRVVYFQTVWALILFESFFLACLSLRVDPKVRDITVTS